MIKSTIYNWGMAELLGPNEVNKLPAGTRLEALLFSDTRVVIAEAFGKVIVVKDSDGTTREIPTNLIDPFDPKRFKVRMADEPRIPAIKAYGLIDFVRLGNLRGYCVYESNIVRTVLNKGDVIWLDQTVEWVMFDGWMLGKIDGTEDKLADYLRDRGVIDERMLDQLVNPVSRVVDYDESSDYYDGDDLGGEDE